MIVNCSFCSSKIERMRKTKTGTHFCDNRCKGGWQRQQRELLGYTKEWVTDQYHVKGKSANQIAREIGRDPKRVWEWIRDYGLETRPRGSDYGQAFVKGQESAFKGKKHTKENKKRFREMRIADGHVPYMKNGRHWLHETNRKPASYRGGITPERQAFYASKEWVDAVKIVWKRDSATCQKCGKHHNQESVRGTFHIHHIISFTVKEKRSDINNLILLCADCHRWVHSKKNATKELIIEAKNESN